MKRTLGLIVALLLMVTSLAFAEDMDLTTFTDEELNGLENAILVERESRANASAEAAASESAFEPLKMDSKGDAVIALQNALRDLGYATGLADGIFGAKTENAVKAYQADHGLEETGIVTEELFNVIVNGEQSSDVDSAGVAENEVPSDGDENGAQNANAAKGVNLATGTANSTVLSASGENSWCTPYFLYPTSKEGLALLADASNTCFTVSFDWSAAGVDTSVDASISLRYTEDKTWYASVGKFTLSEGDSNGHCVATFIPSDDMRAHGTDWLIGDIGEGGANRGIQIELSNFKLELGDSATDWTAAPEDSIE